MNQMKKIYLKSIIASENNLRSTLFILNAVDLFLLQAIKLKNNYFSRKYTNFYKTHIIKLTIFSNVTWSLL